MERSNYQSHYESQVVEKFIEERKKDCQEIERLSALANRRLQDAQEKDSFINRLLIQIAMAYAEIERLNISRMHEMSTKNRIANRSN